MPHPDDALRETGVALDELKLDGVMLSTSYDGRFLGDATFDPLLPELDRRAALVDYSTIVEGLNARAKVPLDGAWTIFGRVVARQSLLQLAADLDSLRRGSFALASRHVRSASAERPLIQRTSPRWTAISASLRSL